MNFAQALEALEQGKFVTSTRWKANIAVQLIESTNNETMLSPVRILILHDFDRNKTVLFTPSVENMFDDEWRIRE